MRVLEQVGGTVNPKKRKALIELTKDLYKAGILRCYASVQREFDNPPGVDEIEVIALEGTNQPAPNPPHDAFLRYLDREVMKNSEVGGRILQNIFVISRHRTFSLHPIVRRKQLPASPASQAGNSSKAPIAMLGPYEITREDRRFLKSLRICCPGDEPKPPLQPTANAQRDKQR